MRLMPLIKTHIDHAVGTITLAHYSKRNSLSEALVTELIAALHRFAAEQVRCIVLRAEPGVAVWSAGHDVGELPEGGSDPLGWQDPLRHLVREIEACPAPIIAMIDMSMRNSQSMSSAPTAADGRPARIVSGWI